MRPGPLIIVSGPAGSGKTTVVGQLLAQNDLPLRRAVTATTRGPREGEQDGVDYHFWTRERFQEEIDRGGLLEYACVHGRDSYGTPLSEVAPYRERGVGVILIIDVQGAAQVRARCPDAVSLFIRTSSVDVLELRLRERGTESDESIRRRLQTAREELARAGEYDYQVLNDDLQTAVAEVRRILAPLCLEGEPCSTS
jgi:guanylate kinase